jgi:hypothetical protein
MPALCLVGVPAPGPAVISRIGASELFLANFEFREGGGGLDPGEPGLGLAKIQNMEHEHRDVASPPGQPTCPTEANDLVTRYFVSQDFVCEGIRQV